MSNLPTTPYPAVPQPRSNGLGIAGFIISLVGLVFTAGLLCPIGLLLSFFALFRAPRGFAFAGFILGLIGSIIPAIFIAIFGVAVFSCFTMGRPAVMTFISITEANKAIEDYRGTHAGALPGTNLEGDGVIARSKDGWGHPFSFRLKGASSYEIRSAGPDGTFDNSDDLNQIYGAPRGPE